MTTGQPGFSRSIKQNSVGMYALDQPTSRKRGRLFPRQLTSSFPQVLCIVQQRRRRYARLAGPVCLLLLLLLPPPSSPVSQSVSQSVSSFPFLQSSVAVAVAVVLLLTSRHLSPLAKTRLSRSSSTTINTHHTTHTHTHLTQQRQLHHSVTHTFPT